MSEEAIENENVQDVSDAEENLDQEQQETEQEAPEQQRPLTPREEKLAEINRKNDQSHTSNFDPDRVDDEGDEPDEDETGETDDSEQEEQEQAAKAPVYQNDAGEWVMKLKVNGEEVERSLDQITATAQKNEAAEVRLQQASQRQKALEQREQQLQEYQAALEAEHQRLEKLSQNTQPSEQDAGENGTEDVKALAAQHRQYLYDGEDDKADEVMAKLLNIGRQQPTLDVDEIVNQAVQRSVQEQQRLTQQEQQEKTQAEYNASLQRGGKWARENYGELLNDPDMYRLVDGKTEELSEQNPDLTPEEVIKQATEYVANRFSKPAENNRQSNKQKLPKQPKRMANNRHSTPPKKEVDTSPQGAIERLKKSRQALQNRPV